MTGSYRWRSDTWVFADSKPAYLFRNHFAELQLHLKILSPRSARDLSHAYLSQGSYHTVQAGSLFACINTKFIFFYSDAWLVNRLYEWKTDIAKTDPSRRRGAHGFNNRFGLLGRVHGELVRPRKHGIVKRYWKYFSEMIIKTSAVLMRNQKTYLLKIIRQTASKDLTRACVFCWRGLRDCR